MNCKGENSSDRQTRGFKLVNSKGGF